MEKLTFIEKTHSEKGREMAGNQLKWVRNKPLTGVFESLLIA